jgi:hypothetical protein
MLERPEIEHTTDKVELTRSTSAITSARPIVWTENVFVTVTLFGLSSSYPSKKE